MAEVGTRSKVVHNAKYTDNGIGDVFNSRKCVIFFTSFEVKGAHVLLERKTKLSSLFFIRKYFIDFPVLKLVSMMIM